MDRVLVIIVFNLLLGLLFASKYQEDCGEEIKTLVKKESERKKIKRQYEVMGSKKDNEKEKE